MRRSIRQMRSPLRLLLVAFALSIALGLTASPAFAAPTNDDFADAQQLEGNRGYLEINLDEATVQASEPLTTDTDDRTVWFKYSPSSTGFATFSICGEDFQEITGANLTLFTGASLGTLDPLEDSSGDCPPGQFNAAVTRAPVTAGTDYYLQIGSTDAAAVTGTQLTYDFNTAVPPNDDFQSPSEITGALPQTITDDNGLATIETDEPVNSAYGPRNSLWYEWTPDASGRVSIDTCSTEWDDPWYSIDSRLHVFSNTNDPADFAGLELEAENDDGCADPNSMLSHVYVDVTSGTPYWIRLSNFGASKGYEYKLKLRWVSTPETILPPRIFPEGPRLAAGDNYVGYSYDWNAEPAVTSTTFQWARCSAAGLDCEPIAGAIWEAYEGQPEDIGHRLRFSVTADNGVTSVTQHSAVSGLIDDVPANDNFADAIDLGSSAPATVADDNYFATIEDDEGPISPVAMDNSVWYRWTAPQSKSYFVGDCDFDGDSRLAVSVFSSTGATISDLVSIGGQNGGCGVGGTDAMTFFAADAGETYWIQVGSLSGEAAMDFTLSLWLAPLPSFSAPPSFNGLQLEGTTLTAVFSAVGSPIQGPKSTTWSLCDSAGDNCAALDGTTAAIDLTNAMVGKRLKALMTLTNANGETSQTLLSDVIKGDQDHDFVPDDDDICPTEASGNPNGCPASEIENDVLPIISGDLLLGKQLTATDGEWTVLHNPLAYELAHQWQRCTTTSTATCTDIASATGSTYTLIAADVGKFIRVNVAASNEDDSTTAESTLTAVITDPSVVPPDTQPPSTTPADPFPQPTAPKSLGKIKLKKTSIKLPRLSLLCGGTATGPCTGTITFMTAKTKRAGKTIKSAKHVIKLVVPPGTTMPTTFKLNSSIVKAVKAAKSLKTSIVIKLGAPGYSAKSLTTSATVSLK